MKKVIVLIALGMATSVFADLTEFNWFASSKTDGLVTSDVVLTYLDDDSTFDMLALISGGQIDIDDFNSLVAINSQNPNVLTAGPVAGRWSTGVITGDGTRAGKYAFAVITDGSVADGDVIRIAATGGLLVELDADGPGGLAPNPAQIFDPGALTSVTVVPEPATIGLFGLGALSAWIIRRNKKKAIEEA